MVLAVCVRTGVALDAAVGPGWDTTLSVTVRKAAPHELRRMQATGDLVKAMKGKVLAKVELPIAGLLSDKRATVVAEESTILKKAWTEMGCTLPYMGFNLLPLSVIPEIRLTDKGLVTVPGMEILPLFEAK